MPQGIGWDSSGDWHKYHLRNVGPDDKVITKKTKDGILIHLLLTNGKWNLQSVHFPKSTYSKESAKSWIKRFHTASVKRTQRLQNEVIGQQSVVNIEDEAQGYEKEWNSAWLLFRSRVDDVLNRRDVSKAVILLGIFSLLNEWRSASRRITWDRMQEAYIVGYGSDQVHWGRLAEAAQWQIYFFSNFIAQIRQKIQDSGLGKDTVRKYLDSLKVRVDMYPRSGWQRGFLIGQRQAAIEKGMSEYQRVLSDRACPQCAASPDVGVWMPISSPLFLMEYHPYGLCQFKTKQSRIFR